MEVIYSSPVYLDLCYYRVSLLRDRTIFNIYIMVCGEIHPPHTTDAFLYLLQTHKTYDDSIVR